jgi:cation diffusion facilitator CzcD-associated flavoprotein CzcO
MTDRNIAAADLDVVIVGAGFGGVYTLHKIRSLGLTARVYEAGGGVGGTWYWNRYPGARCDVESLEYSYQFSPELEQEWKWTERYAPQPEILRYIEHVAERFDLKRDIQLNTCVESAIWDDDAGLWNIHTSAGDYVRSRFCIMATGCLSSANLPKIPGLETFAGRVLHTGRWPHEPVDFHGQRVAVVGTGSSGTGSSGIQAIPLIAEAAAHLTVLQRTPAYSVPAANKPLEPEVQASVKADYGSLRRLGGQMPFAFDTRTSTKLAVEQTPEDLEREFEERWASGGLPFLGAYADLLFDKRANDLAADFLRNKIRSIVKDPAVAKKLMPDTVVGCKRLCSDTDYYATFNRDNVRLVDVNETPIEAIVPEGIRTSKELLRVDTVVFATGFDAMTGALNAIDIRGIGGLSLKRKWAEGPRAYLGLVTAGFPNLFLVTGPGSPSVLSNMVPSIEQHANLIGDILTHMRRAGHTRIEADRAAEDHWVTHVNDVAHSSLYPNCSSWYLGANVPGKPRVFMPYLGFPQYVQRCNEIVAAGYEGFVFGSRETAAA